jgi:Protein of unknown function (DUF2608)
MNITSKIILGLSTVFMTSLFPPLKAEIVETMEISDVLKYATEDTTVLVNISDTLYAPSIALTNNLWRIYFTEQVHDSLKNADPKDAEELINTVKHTIVTQFPKKPVEPITSEVIASLSNKGIPVLGITKKRMSAPYASNFGKITRDHLKHIDIDLEKVLVNPDLSDKVVETISYSYGWGILFTNHFDEGPALKDFMEAYFPKAKKIVMIDNSLKALESVSEAIKDSGIAFTGLHYKRCEVADWFDPDIGTIQFLWYMRGDPVPSDEEAKQIKEQTIDISYSKLLKIYIAQWYLSKIARIQV